MVRTKLEKTSLSTLLKQARSVAAFKWPVCMTLRHEVTKSHKLCRYNILIDYVKKVDLDYENCCLQ